jgi:hypothetical protein
MAKRKSAKSKRSKTHLTRRKAPSGSTRLQDTHGQYEMERSVVERIEASRERRQAQHAEAEGTATREEFPHATDEELRTIAEHRAKAAAVTALQGDTVRPASHHPYGRWEDAMIEQVRLHEWTGTYTGRRYMDDFEAESNSKHVEGAQLPAGFMHTMQMHTLLQAEPVWVSQEMVDLVTHARETWPGEKVLRSDPFVPTGFCLLAKPIKLFDGPPNDHVWIRAIGWAAVVGDMQNRPGAPGCFWVSLYGHLDDQEIAQGVDTSPVGQKLRLAHIFQWTWDTTPVDPDFRITVDPTKTPGDDMDIVHRRAHDQSRTVQTLWRLASQLVPVRHRAPRQLRRDAKRKLKRDLTDVNVITLRRERTVGEKGEPTGRHVSVTSLVSGYWGRRHRREGTVVIWVADYLRGEGPFKQTKRAWEWRR